MPIHTRRDALKAAAVAASIPALLSAGGSLSAQAAGASAFTDSHTVVPLPFDSAKLDGLSKKLIDSHWQNNYAGSVRALNTIQQPYCRGAGRSGFTAVCVQRSQA